MKTSDKSYNVGFTDGLTFGAVMTFLVISTGYFIYLIIKSKLA